MNKKIWIAAGLVLLVSVFLLPDLVSAQTLPTPRPPVSGGGVTLSEVQAIIERIARFLIVVSVIIAVIAIIWGGIIWITSGGNEGRQKSAKAWVWNGVVGALIVLAVGVILQTLAGLVARTFFG